MKKKHEEMVIRFTDKMLETATQDYAKRLLAKHLEIFDFKIEVENGSVTADFKVKVKEDKSQEVLKIGQNYV